jgi:phosphoglycerate dehydrogenase-like enzyme
MVLINNVSTTYQGDEVLIANNYTNFNRIVDEYVWSCIFQLHKKIARIQPTTKYQVDDTPNPKP